MERLTVLGPALNGLYACGISFVPYHRLGLKSSASLPQYVGERCMLIVESTIEAPPGMYRSPGSIVGPLARRMLFIRLALRRLGHLLERYRREQAECLFDKRSAWSQYPRLSQTLMTLTVIEPTKSCCSHFPIFTHLSQDLLLHYCKVFTFMNRGICEECEQRCCLIYSVSNHVQARKGAYRISSG